MIEYIEFPDSNVGPNVSCIFQAGIKKLGTDEDVFTSILVSRSIPYLQKVFEVYLHKHKLSMIDVVKKETSGSLKKAYKSIGNALRHTKMSNRRNHMQKYCITSQPDCSCVQVLCLNY